ncbi:unnamed protein product [Rotaria sp. Silwood2]|nr:unnamed protein product [Rotaria sp. Silwood2]CAF2563020.1 unnamed protein product [Rotaria sp. Silwood2]CAF2967938.1 unnamed protein product [Rotaria sp. Silwood2]CAF3858371.1 unnamed protein product [Rotaria sp. Silwood2]CAF3869319.1 unnamed protein product [Rotaria sp. Silwood2]
MLFCYRWCRRRSRPFSRYFYMFLFAILIGLSWSILRNSFLNRHDDGLKEQRAPSIFCFVLSANDRHLTSSRAIVYSWAKRCDRFYFVTRLQNTSTELMMLEHFENTSDIKSTTIAQITFDVLSYLQDAELFFSYQWFLRASDDSFVIMPNLRRLVIQLDNEEIHRPLACVGDVEQMYEKYNIATTGSVMLFNRLAINRLTETDNSEDDEQYAERQKCLTNMIYDHEFVSCIKQSRIIINPVNDYLILSQNLSTYKMDKRLKDTCCSPNTVAFRSSNETDMYKFEFLYHRLDALSKINE